MKTTDLWFASYLLLKGFKVTDFDILESRKCKFYFDISNEEWKKLRIDYADSEVNKIKQKQNELKDLIY